MGKETDLYKWDANYFRSARIAAYSGRHPLPGQERRKRPYAQWVYNYQERNDTGIYEERY